MKSEYAVGLVFESKKDAESLLALLAAWEMQELESFSNHNYPEATFRVTNIEEI